jgi:hypothetical protein
MNPGLLLTAVVAVAPQAPSAELHVDLPGDVVSVRWCAAEGRALRLRPPTDDTDFRLAVDPPPDRRDGSSWQWDMPTRCTTLRHALGRIADRRREGYGWRAGDTVLAYADTFWWRPEPAVAVEVRARLPPGWRLGAPWLPCDAPSDDCQRVPAEADPLPALIAFGPFTTQRARVGATVVSALAIGADGPAADAVLAGVAGRATRLLAASGIALPTTHLQVLVVAWPRAREPIAFGMVNRGGTGGIVLLADPAASAEAQARDWVLPHELAHLLHPYLGGGRGRWLAEGLASYLQQVLRARAGVLSRDEAFALLFDGFARGAADDTAGPLDAVADARGGLMRTYWGGAAFWLDADLALRARGHAGLPALLDAVNRERAGAPVAWTPARFLARLDEALRETGHPPWFVEAAGRAGAARAFPDRDALAAALGYRREGTRLQPAPGGVDPRATAIMARGR